MPPEDALKLPPPSVFKDLRWSVKQGKKKKRQFNGRKKKERKGKKWRFRLVET